MAQKESRHIIVRCLSCGYENNAVVDTRDILPEYLLRQFDGGVERIISAYISALADALPGANLEASGHGSPDRAAQGPAGIATAYHNTVEWAQGLLRRVTEAESARDDYQRHVDELSARLQQLLADQTGARTDVGTDTHTAHRELADRVASLLPEIHSLARAQTSRKGFSKPGSEAMSETSALIFRVLFAPASLADPDLKRGRQIVAAGGERAAILADQAGELSRQISLTPGYQQWLWDIAPTEIPFDQAFHQPWQNAEPDGRVKFVVIPAYLVNFTVIAKPQVFTGPY
jgi:hypothetical protein